MLFILIVVSIAYMSMSNKRSNQEKKIRKIQEEYNSTNEQIEQKYTEVIQNMDTSVTIVFDANSGEGTMENQTFEIETAQNLTENTFTKTGYTFKEWNTKADGTGTAYVDKQELTFENAEDITLYAQWEANE